MTVDIRFSRTAAKALLRCGKRALVRAKIDQLSTEPLALSANVKKLQGRPAYRLRVQDWRIIFRMEGDILWLDDIDPSEAADRKSVVKGTDVSVRVDLGRRQ